MTAYCGIDVVGLRREHHDWLRRALRDVGYPVGGWSHCVSPAHQLGMSMDVIGAGAAVRRVIKDLVANEVLGYPIKVEVRYG